MNQDTSDNEETCGGTLISREQYLIDVHHWGYRDAREKGGVMSAHEIAVWTNAIA